MIRLALPVVAAVAAGVGWRVRRGRRRVDPVRELADVALHLGRSVRSGATLAEAVGLSAPVVGGSPGTELRRVHHALERGVPVVGAFAEWADAVEGEAGRGARVVAAAVRFGSRHGGDLGAALESAALTLLDRAELADEVAALASQAQASVWVLCLLPVLGAVVLSSIEPAVGHVLWATPSGWACASAAGLLDLGAIATSRVLVRRSQGC